MRFSRDGQFYVFTELDDRCESDTVSYHCSGYLLFSQEGLDADDALPGFMRILRVGQRSDWPGE